MNEPKIFCIVTYGRAGSKLFHSMLDWHPQVMCFPRTLQFNKFWKGVEDKKDSPEYLVDSFIEKHPRFFSGNVWRRFNNKYDKADRLGPNMDETFSVDTDVFREKALSELNNKEITRASLLVSLYRAYHIACGREIPENPLVFYHIHAIECAEDLRACLSDFPGNTYILLMTRHPVGSLKSIVNVMKMRNSLSCGGLFNQHRRIPRNISHLVSDFSKLNIRYLTFEQLLMNHEDVMKSFVNWVGIKWHDNLMASTMHGKLWWGNGKIPRNGISPGWEIYEPKGLLEKKDWMVFRTLLSERMKKLDYTNQSEAKRKFQKIKLFPTVLLPTAAEWSSFKLMFKPSYWHGVIEKIREDIKDERVDVRNMPVELFKQIRVFNPLKWVYYVLLRIGYYYQFAIRNKGETEVIPELLLGKSYKRARYE